MLRFDGCMGIGLSCNISRRAKRIHHSMFNKKKQKHDKLQYRCAQIFITIIDISLLYIYIKAYNFYADKITDTILK